MKEGPDRRTFLKAMAGAAAVGIGAGGAEAAEKPSKEDIARELKEINEKVLELKKAWEAGNKDKRDEIERDLDERYEHMKKLLKGPDGN